MNPTLLRITVALGLFTLLTFGLQAQNLSVEQMEEMGASATAERTTSVVPLRTIVHQAALEAFHARGGNDGIFVIMNSIEDAVNLYDPDTGALLVENYIVDDEVFGTPVSTATRFGDNGLFISVQALGSAGGSVHEFEASGAYVGTFAPPNAPDPDVMSNIRGINRTPDGQHLAVTVAGAGDNQHSVMLFNQQGAFTGHLVAPGAGGLNSPWDVLFRENDFLVSASGSSAIHRYNYSGEFQDVFASGLNFPQQLAMAANGNVLVANFSPLATRGIYEFTPTGEQVRYLPAAAELGGPRGVAELANGNILLSGSAGVFELDRETGAVVTTHFEGGQNRYIDLVPLTAVTLPEPGDGLVFDPPIEEGLEATAESGEVVTETLSLINPSESPIAFDFTDFNGGDVRLRVRSEHLPQLDEPLGLDNFALPGQGTHTTTAQGGVASQGPVVGFSFEGTVAGISGTGTWASDMSLTVTSPDGQSFAVGGFGTGNPEWDFQGSGSTNDGTYQSTHLGVFTDAQDQGTWTFVFQHHWNDAMNWSDVTVTLHKGGVPFVSDVSPAAGSVPAGGSVEVTVTMDATGLNEGSYLNFLTIETDESSDLQALVGEAFEALSPERRQALLGAPTRQTTVYDYPVTLHVTGEAGCAITPDPIAFDGVIVGFEETTTATVSNDGTAACTLTGAASSNDDFTVDFDAPVTLQPGQSADFEVTFAPSEVGAITGTLTLSGDNGDVTAALTGTGIAPPVASVDPTSLTFMLNVDQPEDTQTLTLSNLGVEGAADLEYTVSVMQARPQPPQITVRPEAGTLGARGSGEPVRQGTAAEGSGPFPQTAPPRGGNGEELIQDGGFEAGTPNPYWAEGSTNFGTPLCTVADCGTGTGTGPNTGSWWAWFGGTANAEQGFVEQDVIIPAGSAELSFYLEIPVANTPGFMRVLISGEEVFEVTQADQAAYASYQQVVLDVSAFANGSIHSVRFESTTQPGETTNFFLDDVSLVSTGPAVITVEPSSGTVAAGASTELAVTADASELEEGTYDFELLIQTNDPENPVLVVDVTVIVGPVSGEPGATPVAFALEQNYPNPFASSTTIEFALPEASAVTIEVFDLTGRRVATVVDAEMEAGYHRATWNANGVASGVYLYRIQAGTYSQTLRALVVR